MPPRGFYRPIPQQDWESNGGQWIDDLAINPQAMGMDPQDTHVMPGGAPMAGPQHPMDFMVPQAPQHNPDQGDGQWTDDTAGNMAIMGLDPSTQGI